MMHGRLCIALLSLGFGASVMAQAPTGTEADNLDLRFANGIAAIAEDKVITVDDVRREIAPLVGQLQRDARSEQEFNEKLEQLQDEVIQSLIDRVLIVKEFRKDEKKQIPISFASPLAERRKVLSGSIHCRSS